MGVVVFAAVGLLSVGCASTVAIMDIGGGEAPPPIPPRFARAVTTVDVSAGGDAPAAAGVVAQAPDAPAADKEEKDESEADEPEPYDPWEPFNDTMFTFNLRLDRWVLKPVANVYRHVMPEPFQILIANGFDNIRFVPRFLNNLLQGKPGGAGRELARFLINSTAGIGGLFDPAKDYWGIRPSREDFGQTLGVWGAGPGPYLVLPVLEPMTIRDGIGRGVDYLLDPLGYFIPLFWAGVGMRAGDLLNERALNYELFQGVEETTLDLYSSVRHFYLLRRERLIKE